MRRLLYVVYALLSIAIMRVMADCCSCLQQSDPKSPYVTYDALVYDQCAPVKGICCFKCEFEHGEPSYSGGFLAGMDPLQTKAQQWLEISMSNVAKITFDYFLPHQPRSKFVNSKSTEAAKEGQVFKICPKGPGSILFRAWGADVCHQVTMEYNITVIPNAGVINCGVNGNTSVANTKVDALGASSSSSSSNQQSNDWEQCSTTRGSVVTKDDGVKVCECTGDWSNPPQCNNYSWTRLVLTIGGGVATALSIMFSIRAFYKSRKADKAEQNEDEQSDSVDDLTEDTIRIEPPTPDKKQEAKSPVPLTSIVNAARETTL